MDEQVLHHSSGNKYDKFNNIKEYMEKLESIHTKVGDTGRHKELLRRMYYDKYVIKPVDIPDSYYRHQQEMYFERGYGYVEITEEMKRQYQQQIINDQKASLDVWLNYFISEDAKVYPFWAKYWAFQGMLKLGSYDKEKGEFGRRTKDTVTPFPDLNREALAISIDLIIKMVNKESINDKELEPLLKSGSFGKIYSYVIRHILNDNKNITKRNIGRWIKYSRGSDHMPLVKSLQGYNTGWCTAGEATAKSQLSMGDFYVYYTLDENDEYKVPRIAIRMENGFIAEIRGIAEAQNLEPEMKEVVEEKIKDFPDKEKYYKKISDMEELTKIYKKHKKCEELTKEELTFLYEIDDKIVGFGYESDPRIEEIKNERNQREDIGVIFNYPKNQIAFKKHEIKKDTILFYGDLVLEGTEILENAVLPPIIVGRVDMFNVKNINNVIMPEKIVDSLNLENLIDAKNLTLPKYIGWSLHLDKLTSAEGLVLPQIVGGYLDLGSLKSAKGLVLPQIVGRDLCLGGLTSAEGLMLPQSVGRHLDLRGLKSAKGLMLPQSVESLNLSGLTSAEGLVLPQSMGSLYLNGLTSAEGLVLPQSVEDELYLSGLTSTKGLVLPQSIGSLYLNGLTSAEGLVLPQSVESLHLNGLTSAEGLVLPRYIGWALHLDGLTSAEGLVLPQSVGRYLTLSGLTSAKGLVLPQSVGENVSLKRLTSAEGLIIPEPLTYKIKMCGFEITPENVHEYKKTKK